jgi:predicted GIY-YIG superfamily endonuclease
MFYVYLLCSRPFGTLYIGMTADLVKRVWEHKAKAIPGFTAKYGVDRLVWYEQHASLEAAFARERQIKMEAAVEDRAYRSEQPAVGRSLSVSCALRREQEQAEWWVPAFAGTTRICRWR